MWTLQGPPLITGERADSRMKETASKRGIDLPSWSRQVTPEDFHEFDLISAMDRKNFEDLRTMCPEDDLLIKIKMFTDFRQQMTHDEVPTLIMVEVKALKRLWIW